MKNKIESLIREKPRHYSVLIKKNQEMLDWVMANSQAISDHLPTHIFSALHNESNICEHGNKRKVKRINDGFTNCGPAGVCACTKSSISQNVSKTKSDFSKLKTQEINEKRMNTMISKYGVQFNSQRNDVKKILNKSKLTQEIFNQLNDYDWLYNEYVKKSRTSVDIAQELGCYYGTVLDYCKQHDFKIRRRTNYSIIEKEIIGFLNELEIKNIHSDWDTLKNKELDILIPDYKTAIEVNGLYWHSFHPNRLIIEDRNRHLNKTILCQKQNIDLIHVTDWEWNTKKQLIKSMIRSKFNLNKKIFARKTSIIDLSLSEAKSFFEKYHLQGHVNSQYYIGLVYNNELVMAISAGTNRFKKDNLSIELHRLCSKSGLTVVGGSSKLIKHLQKNTNKNILSYCDFSKSAGNGYSKIGFELISSTGPGFFWTDGTEIISRYKSQKQNLKKWLPTYNSSLSQSENMFAAGYSRYWDCGHLVFELQA